MKTKKPAQTIKPTTMRIPPELLRRAAKVAKKRDRSRSYMIIKWIEDGVAKCEREDAKAAARNGTGAGGALD